MTSLSALPGQSWTILSTASDQKHFATGSRTGSVFEWTTATGEIVQIWRLPQSLPVVQVVWGPNGSPETAILLDGSEWFLRDRGEVARASVRTSEASDTGASTWIHTAPVLNGMETRSTTYLIRGTADGLIRQHDLSGKLIRAWKAHEGAIVGLALLQGESVLLSAGYDGGLARWNLRTGELLSRL